MIFTETLSGTKSRSIEIKTANSRISWELCQLDSRLGLFNPSRVRDVIKSTFLPTGYPHSVRPEYLTYQFWDSVQGMSSYLRSVLTTKALLVGAGVGSSDASALSAALVWVSRDGIGMIGSLVLAYSCCDSFEVNVKEWRLLADVLNNCGLTLDLLTSFCGSNAYFAIVSLSTLCKSSCGLIAGATKARISAHFARDGHLADVTAKESTQETGIALIGLILGMVCARLIGDDLFVTWLVFLFLLVLHQWSNYNLVKVLILDTLNPQRIYLITRACVAHKEASVPSPVIIAAQESLLLPLYLSRHGPRIGCSMAEVLSALSSPPVHISGEIWSKLREYWHKEDFIIGFDASCRVCVSLSDMCSETSKLRAYFLSCHIMLTISGTLQERYEALLASSINGDLRWASESLLSEAGWNMDQSASRLGEGSWRYSCRADEDKKKER